MNFRKVLFGLMVIGGLISIVYSLVSLVTQEAYALNCPNGPHDCPWPEPIYDNWTEGGNPDCCCPPPPYTGVAICK